MSWLSAFAHGLDASFLASVVGIILIDLVLEHLLEAECAVGVLNAGQLFRRRARAHAGRAEPAVAARTD